MSSELSSYAVHRILFFIENDDRCARKGKKARAPSGKNHPRKVNKRWRHVYKLYFTFGPRLPMDYLRSAELALFLRNGLDAEAMQIVFGHGKPLVFDVDRPRMLVPKIIEGFRQLKEDPSFLDVTLEERPEEWDDGTLTDLSDESDDSTHSELSEVSDDITLSELSEDMTLPAAWPQAYIGHLPCTACTKVGAPGKEEPQKAEHRQGNSAQHERLVVEKFHIPSKHFVKQLTVELHFTLGVPYMGARTGTVGPAKDPVLEKDQLRKIIVRLDNISCSSGSQCVMARTSESLLLVPEFAAEVYGFVDRAHVGTSLLANCALNKLILNLRHLLPVHHLSCEFELDREQKRVKLGSAIRPSSAERRMQWSCNVYWLNLRHFRRDLSYIDSRRFKIPSKAGPAADRSLVLHCLSNSHLSDFKMPEYDSRYAIKMLAALADQNVSVGTMRMHADRGGLMDYRSLDITFNGRMRLDTLELGLYEHDLATLVKTTDFFRMSTVQTLKALTLVMVRPLKKSEMPARWAIVNSPLWIAGIQLLHNSDRFEVRHHSDRHLRAIGHKLVELCEKFERGEISELVGHFKFETAHRIVFRFKDENKTASGVEVGSYEWDVYRFRNAAAGEWLTACVGHPVSFSAYTVLHIVKGDVRPDASFASRVALCKRSC